MESEGWKTPAVRIGVSERAPDFTLPVVGRKEAVSLADYGGRTALLLVLNRGFWCSFCRRYPTTASSRWCRASDSASR